MYSVNMNWKTAALLVQSEFMIYKPKLGSGHYRPGNQLAKLIRSTAAFC